MWDGGGLISGRLNEGASRGGDGEGAGSDESVWGAGSQGIGHPSGP